MKWLLHKTSNLLNTKIDRNIGSLEKSSIHAEPLCLRPLTQTLLIIMMISFLLLITYDCFLQEPFRLSSLRSGSTCIEQPGQASKPVRMLEFVVYIFFIMLVISLFKTKQSKQKIVFQPKSLIRRVGIVQLYKHVHYFIPSNSACNLDSIQLY